MNRDSAQDVCVVFSVRVFFGVLMASVGDRIAQIRAEAGFSQSALARAIGTSQSAISQIEAGERNPSFEMLRQIATALDVTPSYLIDERVEGIRPEEEAHFRQYRGLPDAARKELEDFAAYLRQKHRQPPQ
jgi:transcriptional regulator with XRE-family HTH domain